MSHGERYYIDLAALPDEDGVPASVVRKMMERWEVPDPSEAHEVVWGSGHG